MPRPIGNGINARGARLLNVGAGYLPSDAVNLQQLNDAKRGFDLKDPCRATTTSPITTSGLQTLDNVALNAGDRVLRKDEVDKTLNGIWVVSGGNWSRAQDADEDLEVTRGMCTTVLEGTTKGIGVAQCNPILYELTNSSSPVVGTDPLNFAPVGAAGAIAYSAGSGIMVVNGVIAIDPNYSGLKKQYVTTIGDGAASSFTITHGLGTKDVSVDVFDVTADYEEWTVDVTRPTANTVALVFAAAPATGQFRVLVRG